MREIFNLTRRNVAIFFRDRSAVFFSMLSMLIVLGLMVIFLGKMNSDEIVTLLGQIGGDRDVAADRANADYLIQMWTLAGILVVNSMSITLTVMGNMVHDENTGKLMSFYTAPIKRYKIALGYILSAWVVGCMMCLMTLAAGELYMAVSGQLLLAATDIVQLIGMLMINIFVYAALAYLLVLFVHSESAWSGILTIAGTLVGFVGGIYLPMGMLPDRVGDVLKCLPVLHGAAMMRSICTKGAIAKTFAGLGGEAAEIFRQNMGISVLFDGNVISLKEQAAFLLICGIIAVVLASIISRTRRVKDR